MNTSWKHISSLDSGALAAEFTRRIADAAKALPVVGKLRHRSKLIASKDDGAPLAKARQAAMDSGLSTSCVDNGAYHERVFAALVLPVVNGKTLISEATYDDLTYREAITLDKAIALSKGNPAVMPAIAKYLGVCKFRDGWCDTVLERAGKAAGITEDAPTEDAPTEDAPEDAPSNVVAMPEPAKCKNAVEATARIREAIRAACEGLNAKQVETVRANLARALNSPDAFAIFTTEDAQAAAA